VWSGTDNTGGMVLGEYEVFGQVLDATGAEVGTNDIRISYAGGTGSSATDATNPDVAFNSDYNQYLVVWSADNPEDGCVDTEFEIWGQVVDEHALPLYGDAFRISFNGGSGNASFDADHPAAVYNPNMDEYLVVWEADDDAGTMVDDEVEIWAQRVGATGILVGSNLRMSDMGGSGDPAYDATEPDVVYNSQESEYLIVWQGDDNSGGLVDDEYEIFSQLIDESGAGVGPNDYHLSDMGGTGNPLFDAGIPTPAYNSAANEYLVVWMGDDNVGGLVENEWEVFSQRLDADLNGLGANDYRLSDMGGVGSPDYGVVWGPRVVYNPALDRYLVVWSGDDNVGGLLQYEWEVFAQALTPDIQEVGPNDERISDVGGVGEGSCHARASVVAANSANGEFLVAWYGDDNVAPLVQGEFEIFIQRVYIADIFADGFETGDTTGWSVTVP